MGLIDKDDSDNDKDSDSDSDKQDTLLSFSVSRVDKTMFDLKTVSSRIILYTSLSSPRNLLGLTTHNDPKIILDIDARSKRIIDD